MHFELWRCMHPAYTARHADQAAELRQQELQISETRRQREHEQMIAQVRSLHQRNLCSSLGLDKLHSVNQITRIQIIVDDCCGPSVSLDSHHTYCICSIC
eukprot:SAG31_NODE_8652_length_1413_cov_1.341705_1_plen_99_part_10